jgi:hypothetical protein
MLSAEHGLALGIIAFYLFDCLRLTPPETVYFLRNTQLWSYRIPQQRWRSGSKSVELLNPFMPWQLPLAARLLPNQKPTRTHLHKNFVPAITALILPQGVLAVLVVVAMPFVIIREGLGEWFLLCMGLIYLVLGYSLIQVKRNAKVLNLNRAQFISVSVECLFCPPFAVNLVRKIAAQQVEIADAALFATRYLESKHLILWRQEICQFAQEQQQWYESSDANYQKWQALQCRVQGNNNERN